MNAARYLSFVGLLFIGLPFVMSGLSKLAAFNRHCGISLFSITPRREGNASQLSPRGPRLLRKTFKETTERVCEKTRGTLGARTACLLVAAVSCVVAIPGLCCAQVQLPTAEAAASPQGSPCASPS
jgi:hypothetical protein